MSLARFSALGSHALGATQIRPKQRLLELIAKGKMNSGMAREEAVALRDMRPRTIAGPKLKREIAVLMDVCIAIGGGDCVLGHIRDLKDVDNVPRAKEFDRAARWVRQKQPSAAMNNAAIFPLLRWEMEARGTIGSAPA